MASLVVGQIAVKGFGIGWGGNEDYGGIVVGVEGGFIGGIAVGVEEVVICHKGCHMAQRIRMK